MIAVPGRSAAQARDEEKRQYPADTRLRSSRRRRRGEDKTDWAAVAAKTEEELAADMASDPAWEGVPAGWVSRANAATGLMRRPA
jgi:hypothetical protein